MKDVANFLFEVGILAKTPRSGFHFLGTGKQSVAEHINRVCFIGYSLGMLEGDVDVSKIMKMCLLHDVAEARTSDLNYVHQKYVKSAEEEAVRDLTSTLPFGHDMAEIINEYEERKSKESLIAKDADNLELILSLKEQSDLGNAKADSWMSSSVERLQTEKAKELAEAILKSASDDWWFNDKEKSSKWWVDRSKK